MSKKILKKLSEKEEKLIEAIYDIQDYLDSTDDEELSSMGNEFVENLLDFLSENDTITLNDIRNFIEESSEG